MNSEAYAVAMRLVELPGGWASIVEYGLTEQQRKALAAAQLQPLQRRCEVIGGFGDWRVHVDYGLVVGGGWFVRGGYLARRTADLCPKKFRDFLYAGPLPDVVLLRADGVKRLLRSPTADWSALWSELRKNGDEK